MLPVFILCINNTVQIGQIFQIYINFIHIKAATSCLSEACFQLQGTETSD